MMSSKQSQHEQTGRRGLGRLAAGSAVAMLTTVLVAVPALAVTQSPAGTPRPALYYLPSASVADSAARNTDWAGYDVTDGSYTSVSASWVEPTVSCTTTSPAYSALWVGLDGDGSTSVEQIGTSADCDNGTPTYSAWYEFYPAAST